MIRIKLEREKQMQKAVHLCFIDQIKSFDKGRHKGLFELLGRLDLLDDKIIQNPYCEQTAYIRIVTDCMYIQ